MSYNKKCPGKVYEFANPYILKHIEKGKVILDVGCGTGALGARIKKIQKNQVYGIDISPASLKKARQRLDKVYSIDIENNLRFPFKNSFFDVIIFGDVLEHVRNPEAVLLNAKKYIKRNGIMIISLPNIANWYYRLRLLLGIFDYAEEGIMDDTHVRFYTLKTAKELIENAGLRIVRLEATPGSPIPIKIFPRLKYWLSQGWKTLFGNGFVFVVERK